MVIRVSWTRPQPVFILTKIPIEAIIKEISTDLLAIESGKALLQPYNFTSRAEALDFIDFHVIGRLDSLSAAEKFQDELKGLYKRAEATKAKLELVNRTFFACLRASLRNKSIDLNQFVLSHIGDPSSRRGEVGYDLVDEFFNGLICTDDPPEASLSLESGMVFYQKTPARIIFELATFVQDKQIDVFIDLGSGLGQSVILFHLLTGSRCTAVEYEPAYHAYAIHCAARLGVDGVTFINADARDIAYPDKAVFYVYTTFEGTMLAEMLKIIERKSIHTPVWIFTYGPCSSVIVRESWLSCIYGDPLDPYSLCGFIGAIAF